MSVHEETLDGMTGARWRVLDYLADQDDPVRQITIIEKLGSDRSTMSAMLEAMRRDNLVLLERDPADGRARLATISAPGRELHAKISRRMAKMDAKVEESHRGLRGAIERFLGV